MYDVDRLGIGKVMEETNDYLQGRNLHLSFDIDALDPFFAPHTGEPCWPYNLLSVGCIKSLLQFLRTHEILPCYFLLHHLTNIPPSHPVRNLGTAVRGGLTFREGNYICESLAETSRLTSMELVEVNPSLHTDINPTRTIEMGLALIGSTMGQTIL